MVSILDISKKYRIGEVAEMLNVNTSTLRFWETQFPQIDSLRTEKGQRFYTEEKVNLLRRIHQLLHEQGMTIGGAKRILEGSTVIDEEQGGKICSFPNPAFMQMLLDELTALRKILSNKDL